MPQTATPGLRGLLDHAAFAPLRDSGMLRVTGDDRVRWLNGMVTNSIQALTPGEGCYNYSLNAQGRIQADATAFALSDSLLLESRRSSLASLAAMLDRFIIMDDVELSVVEGTACLLVAGPAAAGFLTSLSLPAGGLSELTLRDATFEGAPVDLIHAHSPLVPRFELWSSPATLAALSTALAARLPEATADDLQALRLLEGTPLFGIDIRDRDLPQETALPGQPARALHFSKGCYLGQEIVERIRSRGNVHRTLAGFVLSGPLPAPNSPLYAASAPDKTIGEITSAASVELPRGAVTLALGSIRRETLEAARGNPELIRYSGGFAAPVLLPYDISPPA